MKQPGDDGRQGIDIDRLTVHPEITRKQALELAEELAEDANVPYEVLPDEGYIEPEFVKNAIDFREGDRFLVIHPGGPNDHYQVVSDHNWNRDVYVAPIDAEPGHPDYEGTAWGEFASHVDLWWDWLRGRVVEVRKESRFIRTDTREEIDV